MTEKQNQPIKITPHLYQLGTKRFPAYLSMGEKGMLIEGGTGATSDIIVQQVEKLGINPLKISYLVLPHTHADHVGAVPRIRDIWPHIKIIASEIGAKFLAKEKFIKGFLPAENYIIDLLVKNKEIETPPEALETYNFKADEALSEGEKIDLGEGIVWHVHNAPGHCPDHIALFEEKENTLVIGDITGYYDPDLNRFWPNYFTTLETYCDSIRKLASLPAKRALLSHNGVINHDVTDYLKKALGATKAFHDELLSRLDAGEDEKDIAKDKGNWVFEFSNLAPLAAIVNLNRLLIKKSLEERDKVNFDFPTNSVRPEIG